MPTSNFHYDYEFSMICDFFFPNMGGVEIHLFNLSQCLMQRGHKVVIITHAYTGYSGIRYFTKGLKVYYLPIPVMYNQCTVPTIISLLPYFRSIFIRECIDHVHGHQAFSNMCHEGIWHARTMGIPCTFTDHSLFGFADTSSILTNKLLKFTLSDVENVICVSNTSKENTVLRAALDPERVFVIPNAVTSSMFTPDPTKADPHHITVVILSRLVYRKGIDLLVAIIPRICEMFPNVKFLIAGDGPKKVDLEQMRDELLLHDRVELMGPVPSEEARNVLVRGHIFLNTSLTEAFCMAIVEAACCGLLVVSTKVGGVPEVLPSTMLKLSSPDEDQLTFTLSEAIKAIEDKSIDTSRFHEQVSRMYSWPDVAARTEAVYLRNTATRRKCSLIHRLSQYYGCGELLGKIACCLVILDYLLLLFLEWVMPTNSIDIAPDYYCSDNYEKELQAAIELESFFDTVNLVQ